MTTFAGELVLEFRGSRVETEDELVEIEDALAEMLVAGEAIAGREIAPHARSLAIATPDARATWLRVQPFLARAGLADAVLAGRRAGESQPLEWLHAEPAR